MKKYGVKESDVARRIFSIGMKHVPEIDERIREMAEKDDIIMEAKSTLEWRRAIGHFAGHQSGWRETAERIESPLVQREYLASTEKVSRQIQEFLSKEPNTKNNPKDFFEWLREDTEECIGCTSHIKEDAAWCKKNCRMARKLAKAVPDCVNLLKKKR